MSQLSALAFIIVVIAMLSIFPLERMDWKSLSASSKLRLREWRASMVLYVVWVLEKEVGRGG